MLLSLSVASFFKYPIIMKQKLLFLVMLLAFNFSVNAQFALGDIAFSAYGSETAANTPSGPADAFTIVLLRNVNMGEQITFTDNGWFTNLGGLRAGETSCTFTFGAAYTEGAQIIISADPFEARDENGSIAGTLTGSALSLSTGGDSILAYNTGSVPTTGDQSSFIAAMTFTGQWLPSGSGDSSTSTELPSVFTDGVNAISVTGVGGAEVDNGRISFANCNNFSDIATLRTMLNTLSNWETDNSTAYDQSSPICDFKQTLGISDVVLSDDALTVSPNPVTDRFSIRVANNITINKVEIYNITGQNVLTINQYVPETWIDMSNLGSGIYMTKIYSGGKTTIKKLLKK